MRGEALTTRAARFATPLCILSLCVLGVAFFWKIVALNHDFIPMDILYAQDPLWQPSARTQANLNDMDLIAQVYPWTALAEGALRRGVVALWNPYSFSGTPFLGAMQPAVLYPINLLLEWLAPPDIVVGLRAMVHLALTLVGTFLFARSLSLSRPAALLAAISFGLGLGYMGWLGWSRADACAWLPWLLLCIERVVVAPGRAWWAAALALVVALEFLAGHGEETIHIALLCGAYALFRLALTWRRDRDGAAAGRRLLALAAGASLGAGIAAAQVLPILAQIPTSGAVTGRGAAILVPLRGEPGQWKTLLLAAVPDFFGNPTWPHDNRYAYQGVALYVGAVPLVLAGIALARRRDAYVVFFAAAAAVALGVAARLPVLGLINNLPVLHVMANDRLRMLYTFAAAILAGYGLDVLCQHSKARMLWRLTGLWWLILAVVSARRIVTFLHSEPWPIAARLALPLVWLGLFVGLLWLRRRGVVSVPALRGAIVAATMLDLFVLGVGYHTTVPRAMAAVTPPAVSVVQRDRSLYRVAGLGNALLMSTSDLYHLQDVRGYDPAAGFAYAQFFKAALPALPGFTLGLSPVDPGPAASRVLDVMNVKYIFAACDIRLDRHLYRPVYRGAGCVYRNDAVLPRAFLVHTEAPAAPSRAAALLRQGLVDPRSTVLLDPSTGGSSAGVGACAMPRGRARGDMARVIRYDLDRVDLTVRSAACAVLVLADAYADGWYAYIDGRSAPIIRADGVFRAVALRPGTQGVSFVYEPRPFVVGVTVSAAAVALWLLLLIAPIRVRTGGWRRHAAGQP